MPVDPNPEDLRLLLTEPVLTERLVLRTFRPDDADGLFAIHGDAGVTRYLYGDARSRAEMTEVTAERVGNDRIVAEGDKVNVAVLRRDTGRLVGDLMLRWTSAVHRQVEIGFVFHSEEQGRGFAREGCVPLLDRAFGDLRAHRVYGRTDARNTASANLMRRLGMRQEAHLRENEVFKGEWGDELVFAILEDEWRGRTRG